MEHKLNNEQKEEFKSELEQGLEDLKAQLEQTVDGWETLKRNCTIAIVGTGVVAFAAGIVVGKSL
ncbi:hypothetical protein KAR91_10160 [Candidatus Pacearchaeota archaeon]|nr:hypothetical protein [Candidatus Pacearchaeota archaeon]